MNRGPRDTANTPRRPPDPAAAASAASAVPGLGTRQSGLRRHRTGDHARAVSYFEQALAVFRDLGDSHQEADILSGLAEAHAALGQHHQAVDAWEQALLLHRVQHRGDRIEGVQAQLAKIDRSVV